MEVTCTLLGLTQSIYPRRSPFSLSLSGAASKGFQGYVTKSKDGRNLKYYLTNRNWRKQALHVQKTCLIRNWATTGIRNKMLLCFPLKCCIYLLWQITFSTNRVGITCYYYFILHLLYFQPPLD